MTGRGGECPVDPTTTLKVVFRDGELESGLAGGWVWNHSGAIDDIVKYYVISEKPKSASETPSQSLQELTDNYVKAVRELTGSTATSYNLFINCEGVEITENKRTPEDLKASGCSMRNLKGEFIK